MPSPTGLTQFASWLRRTSRILWVRVALMSALAVVAALSALLLDPLIPPMTQQRFSAQSILPVLTILANGMLAVATFSLGVMVSSHRTLAQQATPRIHRLLLEDTSTQTMLATFIGAFVYALVAIILFNIGAYSSGASVVVFIATLGVVLAIVVSLVRWIARLTRLGSLDYALDQAEAAAAEALAYAHAMPRLGARPPEAAAGAERFGETFGAASSGYVQRIDMDGLQEQADSHGQEFLLLARPGDLVLAGQPLLKATALLPGCTPEACFEIASSRSHDQDPRYGVQALGETASRALSPGINDPGTALEVIARLERLCWDYARLEPVEDPPKYGRLYLHELNSGLLLRAGFEAIARDGAGFVEVQCALVEALATLHGRLPPDADDTITQLLEDIRERTARALSTGHEKTRIEAALAKATLAAG
ncbi:DUF2254 domain-containing protein [Pseudoruegeria sp. SHC-113]|uniref:DUF2254 domain-containing protein n=1 Tax=Pseudoruegeria sp. SHC-113 TaxID=2855439 RepID=UPI0021BB5BD1|nr:DUF2254 domain-containing protein [Pseudoruegeria sp. SHC-113]MCT8160694.1 DUF2254 domain-containing protein [Pseudoruegeria sp. SHC-113]